MRWVENENIIIHRVNKNNLKLEGLLKEQLNISGRLFRKLEKSRSLYLNDKVVKGSKKVKEGDVLVIVMEDETPVYDGEPMDLKIIYEDHDILIINKEPYMVVHPTKSHSCGTVANGVAYYFKERGIKKKVRLVSRLDMDTSGALVIAKNPFGHQQMAAQFDENKVQKKYLAIVKGIMNEKEGTIDLPIGQDEENPIRNKVRPDGKPSITKYRVVQTYDWGSLVELEIITGRTHQIRVHLNYLGYPIIGDHLYDEASPFIQRQALHAHSLKFHQPRTGEVVYVEAPLPKDMEDLLKNI